MRFRPTWAASVLAIVAVSPLAPVPGLKSAVGIVAQRSDDREASRERWQKVPEILALMSVESGSEVADVGAGRGFFTVRLASAVGEAGRVYAVDVADRVLGDLRARVEREGLANVDVIRGVADDPRLPAGRLDAALINNAYHEMDEHQAMLERIRDALRPGGRLVIVDQVDGARREAGRSRQVKNHEIALDVVEGDLRLAGYEIVTRHDPFIERGQGSAESWWLIVARRPVPAPSGPKLPGCRDLLHW